MTALQQQEGTIQAVGQFHPLIIDQDTEERFRQLKIAVEAMQLGVTITDLRGTILYTNPAEATMHGYRVADLLGKDLGVLAPPELRRPLPPEEMPVFKRLRESINIRSDGSLFPVRLMSDVITDTQGHPVAIVTTCEDISERKRVERMLKQRTRELMLLNRMSEFLQACLKETETYQVIGKVCKKLFPADSGCLCMMDPVQLQLKVVEFWGTSPHTSQIPIEPAMPIAFDDSGVLCPYQNGCVEKDCLCAPITTSGEILGLLSLCFRHGDHKKLNDPYHANSKAKYAVLTRIAEQYALALINLRLRENLRMECLRDPLTGLYNRRYMEESLEREGRRAKRRNTPIGIIMLDIDHFKHINDVYGHDAGDMVLRELGEFFQHHTRGEDIVCRYGGEEFLLILPEAPIEVVLQRAKELHRGVQDLKLVYQGHPLLVSISAGVAVLPQHGQQVGDVVKAADEALYQAKVHGRDQVWVASGVPKPISPRDKNLS